SSAVPIRRASGRPLIRPPTQMDRRADQRARRPLIRPPTPRKARPDQRARRKNACASSATDMVLRIAIAGLGTVGAGVLKLLHQQAELLAGRCGKRVMVAAVSARDRTRDRGVDLAGVRWYADATALAADPEIDIVVELIGGADGVAKGLCELALGAGKRV